VGGAGVGLAGAGRSWFELDFVDVAGLRRREGLRVCSGVAFEDAAPVRAFRWSKGQRSFAGWWWSSTTGRHVGYESWLERDHLMLLDFDPGVVAVASQPWWVFWTNERGQVRSHVPDYFARRVDADALVLDCRPAGRITPKDAARFDATRRACEQVGWRYHVVGASDPIVTANVRWLSGYRHPRHELADVAAALRHAFGEKTGLMAGAESAGDPIAVLPVLFHLLWRHELEADLSVPLHPDTVVATAVA
jgi:hypothetical protein